jgi:hypothetical protein
MPTKKLTKAQRAGLVADFRSDLLAVVAAAKKIVEKHATRGLSKRELVHAYIDAILDESGVP